MSDEALVIGAGIAGLATAGLLAREGYQVTVLERSSGPGGRAGRITDRGFTFDTGPSWFLMPEVYEHFYRLMGTSLSAQLDLQRLDPAYRVLREPTGDAPAQSLTLPAGADRVAAAFEAVEPGAGAALERYLDSAHEWMALSTERFLYNPYTSARSMLSWSVLRRLGVAARIASTSLASFAARSVRTPILRQTLSYPAVFLGADPRDAPAIYHLMSAMDLDEGVFYPRGGFHEVVTSLERLALAHGARIVYDAAVQEIRTTAGQVEGVRWRDPDGRDHHRPATVVVSCADLHHTETELLAEPDRSYPEQWWDKQVSGPGAIIAMLGVDGALPELDHHTLLFARDWNANFDAVFHQPGAIPAVPSLYVSRTSATDATVAPVGSENLFILIPVPADVGLGCGGIDGAGDETVERTVDGAIGQIARWAGIPDLAERIVVRRTLGPGDFANDYHSWSGGMLGPAHLLRQSAMFRTRNASRKVGGLYYAGATTSPGVGVPMCLISAEIVLKRLRRDSSAGPLPVPPTSGVS